MITTGTQEEILLVGQDGDDLVVRVRRLAAALRMREPVFRFADALGRIPRGEPLDLEIVATRYRACATVNGVVRCVGRPAMGSTWTLAIEEPASSSFVHRLLDAVTILVLALPFGLLLRSVARRQAVAAGVTLAVALPIVAWTSGLALPSLWEWAGVLLAVGAGLAVNKSVRRARAT